jgi:micrococcal nuclease
MVTVKVPCTKCSSDIIFNLLNCASPVTCDECGDFFTQDELLDSFVAQYLNLASTIKVDIPSSVLYYYKAKITEIVDGDTFYADVDLGFNTYATHKFRVACLRPDSLNSKHGVMMTNFDTGETTWRAENSAELLHGNVASDMLSNLILGKEVILITRKAGKYGRWLADIIIGGTINNPLTVTSFMKEHNMSKLPDYSMYEE